MWPWEHVLFAYVFFSIFHRMWYGTPPPDWPVVALVVGSLLPDVIDKPLAWQFGIFEGGYAVGHSVFVAIPVSLMIYLIARQYGFERIGLGFIFGYLLHLVGDVLPPTIRHGELRLEPILWPFVEQEDHHTTFIGGFQENIIEYATYLLALEMTPVLMLQLGSVFVGILLWLVDGMPGGRILWSSRKKTDPDI